MARYTLGEAIAPCWHDALVRMGIVDARATDTAAVRFACMATRYDSGVSGTLTERGDLDVRAWLARLLLDLEEQPIGSTSTCANPECDRPVDYIGQGHAPHYCCKRCKNRAGEIRRRAAQQLDVITEFLEASRGKHGIPRGELEHRARMLRWWLEQMPQDG